MEKTNWIVALVVGALVGFFVGHYTAGPSVGTASSGGPVAQGAGDVGKTPADLPAGFIKESELPAGTLSGLTDQQKYTVLKVTNDKPCTCGCANDSIAKCRAHDPSCSTAPKLMAEVIAAAKQGKSAAEIERGLGAAKPAAPSRPSDDPNLVYKVPVLDSPVRGNADAKVTIVEFSDFQCPFCGRAEGTVEEIRKAYGNDVRIVYKQNPLPFHPHAMPASKAALAAGMQGKFWEMHDLLFKNQRKLEASDLEGYAKQLGLNMAKWKADQESPAVAKEIATEKALAAKLGASGTPAFFINGHKLVGAQPFASFKAVIDAQKAAAEKLLASGTKPADLYAAIIAHGVDAPPAAPSRPRAPAATAKKVDIAAFNPVKGPATAPVTIVEWSDFQCPFCGRVEPTLKQIHDTYGDKIRFVWRNEPLPFHPHAMPAAKAAMAALEQGQDKFWAFHDILFKNQRKLEASDLEAYAKQAGLNIDKWKADQSSPKIAQEISEDQKAGQQVGANGTPAFFINGKSLSGAQPFASFKAVIDDQLKKAEMLEKKGVKGADLYAKLTELNIAEGGAAAAPPAPAPNAPVTVAVGNAPTRGPTNAPVTVVEFSDFQCPFCGRAFKTMNDVEKAYAGKIRVVFKQNPLPFHPHALPAAQASLSAAAHGKFWQMYDQLFENQRQLERADLDKYAAAVGLNAAQFKSDMDSGKYKAAVEADLAEGRKVGVTGTPTFVIGTGTTTITGEKLVGAQPIDAFKRAIDAELAKAGHGARNVARK